MQERHHDRERYFKEQAYTTARHVVPFVAEWQHFGPGVRVLEVGCGEGGNLQPFLDAGCTCVGVDLREGQIELAKTYYAEHANKDNLTLLAANIYDVDPAEVGGAFDFIFLRDVIEHIVDQEQFLRYIHAFLRPKGTLFMGYPPWYMPFGGHQQICRSRLLSKLPYFHLLPRPLYRGILRLAGESPAVEQELMEIADTGISIERLRHILQRTGYRTLREQLWLINPNYEVKFGLQPRAQWGGVAALPGLRNFFTTCVYIVVAPSNQ